MTEHQGLNWSIVHLARAHRAAAGVMLRRIGLYPGQELLLFHLGRSGPCHQSDLVKALQIDASTVTKTLRRMENCGLVSRKSCPDDSRATRVSLTPAGNALLAEVDRVWTEFEAVTTEGLDAAEQSQATALLARMETNLEHWLAGRCGSQTTGDCDEPAPVDRCHEK